MSKLVVLGYSYLMSRKKPNRIYWVCQFRKNKCKGILFTKLTPALRSYFTLKQLQRKNLKKVFSSCYRKLLANSNIATIIIQYTKPMNLEKVTFYSNWSLSTRRYRNVLPNKLKCHQIKQWTLVFLGLGR